MSKNKRKRAGVGAILARILVVILVMIVGGIASFFGVRTFFLNKFQKEKKEEVAKQLEDENKERVDVVLMQAGDSMAIRIYHNKNQHMIYIPLRSDMELSLTDSGKKAIEQELGESVENAAIADVIKSTKGQGDVMKEQVEETLNISVNSYEIISDDDLAQLVDDAGEIQVDLEQAITYEDASGRSVTLTAGENTLDGEAVLALASNESMISDENDHVTLIGDILAEVSKALSDQTLSDYKDYMKNYYQSVDSDKGYDDVKDYLERMHSIADKDFNYKILEGTESGGEFRLDTDAAKEVFDQLLSEEGDLESVLDNSKESSTEDAKEEKTKEDTESSKDISIEIQNSTKISGLASNWKDKLMEDGYTVGSIKTNRQGVLTHTKIIIAEKGMGEDLKSYFKNPEYEVGEVTSGAKICIILGTEDEI